jgi:glutathione S-transferase
MPDVILYAFPPNNFVRSCRMAMDEKGVAYRLEEAAP